MGRFKRGWLLSKQSWAVVKADRSLLAFPVISSVAAVIMMVFFFGGGVGMAVAVDSLWAALPLAIIGAYLLTVIGIFTSVALACCAAEALEGRQTTVRQGLGAAHVRLKLIFTWAAVVFFVGLLITLFLTEMWERFSFYEMRALLVLFLIAPKSVGGLGMSISAAAGSLVGIIVGGLAGFVWAVATFFVIPVIALDGLGPKESIKTSIHVIKQRWGESVVGSSAIGVITFLVIMLPAVIVIGLGVLLLGSSVAGGGALIVIGVIVLMIGIILQVTISSVFRVTLYRYATEGKVLGGFDAEHLEAAFTPRKRSGISRSI